MFYDGEAIAKFTNAELEHLNAYGFLRKEDGNIWINEGSLANNTLDFNKLFFHEFAHSNGLNEVQANHVEQSYGQFLDEVNANGYIKADGEISDWKENTLTFSNLMTLLTVTPDGIEMKPFTISTEKAEKLPELIFTLDQIDKIIKNNGIDSDIIAGIFSSEGYSFKYNSLKFLLDNAKTLDHGNGKTTIDLDLIGVNDEIAETLLKNFIKIYLGDNLQLAVGKKHSNSVDVENRNLEDAIKYELFNDTFRIGTGSTIDEVLENAGRKYARGEAFDTLVDIGVLVITQGRLDALSGAPSAASALVNTPKVFKIAVGAAVAGGGTYTGFTWGSKAVDSAKKGDYITASMEGIIAGSGAYAVYSGWKLITTEIKSFVGTSTYAVDPIYETFRYGRKSTN